MNARPLTTTLARLRARHNQRRAARMHPGWETGPGIAVELGAPLDAHAARAALVDLAALLRVRAASRAVHRDHTAAADIDHARASLEAVLRRWDIAPTDVA